MTTQPHPHAASRWERLPSGWSTAAVAAAALAWVGGVLLHLLGVVGPAVAALGVVAAAVAFLRERRSRWRVAVAFAGLASLAAATIYALVLTSTIGWSPAGW
jgi:hypothetical protein